MKKSFLNILLFLVVTSYASNDKYRLILTDNPATTIMIGWNQISGTSPKVHYGTTDYGTNWQNYPSSKSIDRSISYKGMSNTFAKLTGLTPNTNYYFVIRDSQGTSNRFWFKTAPSNNQRMSFIAGGDSRNNRAPRRNANLLVSKLKPTAVFFGGDMTNGDSSSEWQSWFNDWQYTIATDGRMFPIIPARGNHEDSNNSIYNLFNVSSSNVYYDITFGNNLYTIYTLNSEISAGGNQYSWLNQKLNGNSSIWKSAQYHKPMRPHVSSKSEGNDEYANWAQLFYDKGVNLVFESDSHTVKTTWPVKPCSGGSGCDDGFIRDNNNGTTYVGEGCWGAPLRSSNDAKNWTRNNGTFNQFKWIFVEESKIEVRTIKVDNANNVGSVTNDNPFTTPSNLDVWNPSNGSVVTIINSNVSYPEVTLTNPIDGSTHKVNIAITINANASDSDGTIANVKFYVNDNLIKTDTSSPYSTSWTPSVNNQSYILKTVAIDNDGNETISKEVSIFVGEVSKTITSTINSGDDDAEQYESSGKMYMNSSDLELVYDGSSKGNQHIGLLFRNLNIPTNATITSAYIQFTTDETNSGNTSLGIKIEDSSNAQNITSQGYNITSRSYYNKTINWNPNSWTTVGESGNKQKTPELKELVQKIINKSSWSLGNSMMFYISGTGERTAESYEGSSSKAPKLVITYTTGSSDGGGNTPKCEDVYVTLVFDKYSKETSWTLKNSSNEVVMSGGNYTQGNGESITVSKCLPVGCYDFSINDTYGDGICCDYGNGSYKVTKTDGTVLVSGGSFTSSDTKQFCLMNTSARKKEKKETSLKSKITLYPNPTSDRLFISGGENTLLWIAKVLDISGKKILEVPVINSSINISNLTNNSIYFIEIFNELGENKLSEKIIKK
ncbi:Por secretion system C-terminal sorting domain-containing protein [Tenacibaculum sp. MAR_2010_89]|uniref:Ig-like domain-containing protein n=1 Tax=Tenacibaculum sp. MAR_2010_89 TaxID=1250198 RepID=UPI000897B98B|nr:Ig-like domain-containing protein [Tenacibaculum sp. MAR_2010_89]SEE04015.1 Por secretion system C-terminal sorting domain-containing protein [Tenacibaculum sp. MAR_2010_89]